jgi:hypothetical protein
MAVTAKFVADFSSFTAAVEKAQVSLKNVEADANKVGASLNRMADNFSGRKLINEALLMTKAVESVGGASALTASEMAKVNGVVTEAISKYTALGKVAPQSMVDLANATKTTTTATTGLSQAAKSAETATGGFASGIGKLNSALGALGIGLSVGAVVAFGRSLLTMGDEIVRVADRTGLTTDEVQKLSYVAGQSGNTIDELTQAIGQMQNRLSSGDKSAVGSIKELNLNFSALIAASPAKQLEMIATEIAKIPDPADRTRIAMDLFGKAGTAILPTLTAQFAKLAEEAPVASEKVVRALDTAGDQLNKFGLQIKVWAAESYIWIGSAFDKMVGAIYRGSAAFIDAEAKLAKLVEKLPGGKKALDAIGFSFEDLSKGAQWFRDAAAMTVPPLEAVTDKAKQLAPALRDVAEHTEKGAKAVANFRTENEKLLPSIDTWGMGIGQLNSRLVTVTGTIGDLTLGMEDLVTNQLRLNQVEIQTGAVIGGTVVPAFAKLTAGIDDMNHRALPEVAKKTDALGTAFNSVETILGNVQTKFAQTATVLVRMADAMIKKFGSGDWIGGIVAGVAGGIQLITSLFTNAEKAINKTRKAFVDAAGGLDMLRDKATAAGVTINELLNAKNAQQYEEAIRKLNQAFEEHEADVSRAKELIDEYGLSIEQLGPAWRAQELDKQVQGLMNDLRIMVDVLGLSMPDALVVMADKFNDAFQTALKFGMELPAQMQPVLEKLVEMGKLVDENGEVVTDLQGTGVKFSESFSKSVDRLIDKFDEFLQKIGLIPGVLAGIPDRTIHVGYQIDPPPDLPGFAAGGVVPARVLPFRPRGTDTVPAMLTPGEGILTRAEMRALGGVAGFNDLRRDLQSGRGTGTRGDTATLDAILAELRRQRLTGAATLARAVRDEVQKAGRR